MPWAYIVSLLGPGLHWGRSAAELEAAVARAEAEQQPEAAAHLRIILQMRNRVHAVAERMYPDADPPV